VPRCPTPHHTIPDLDYLTQLEEMDGQKMKRRSKALRGKPIKAPHLHPR
jgi:hypothetical protein